MSIGPPKLSLKRLPFEGDHLCALEFLNFKLSDYN